MKTTENLKAKQFKYIEKPCHGGKGPWYFKDMLDGISRKDVIQYIHDDILPPGSEFGIHCHSADDGPDEEWYLCISGKGTMNDMSRLSGSAWRVHAEYIDKVIIEEGVTGIGNYCFYNCQNLKSIVIPSSIAEIGNEAFALNEKLYTVYIRSEKIAQELTEASSCGYLANYAKTIMYEEEFSLYCSGSIKGHFNKVTNVTSNGVEYVSYSDHVHSLDSYAEIHSGICMNCYAEIDEARHSYGKSDNTCGVCGAKNKNAVEHVEETETEEQEIVEFASVSGETMIIILAVSLVVAAVIAILIVLLILFVIILLLAIVIAAIVGVVILIVKKSKNKKKE